MNGPKRPGEVGLVDWALAAAATTAGVFLVLAAPGAPGPYGPVVAVLGVLPMTAPLLARQRAPVAVAAIMAAGAVLNALLMPGMTRCGACLPALFLVAYTLGRLRRGTALAAGAAAAGVSVVAQALGDLQLEAGMLLLLGPLTAGFVLAGVLVARRQALLVELRARNVALKEQREATAQLAVAAESDRVATGLDAELRGRLGRVQQAAAGAAAAPSADATRAALAAVEQAGRDTLAWMRETVGELRGPAPAAPAPLLTQLRELVPGRLSVGALPTDLPPGVELAAYRIVEHLLDLLFEERAEVDVTVEGEVLVVSVRGPERGVEHTAPIAAARARAALAGGTLAVTTAAGRCEALARLPLPSAHAY